jgi:carbonic anhydrase/acetyltransferase-like protein (isoleucine patch superfamily)
VDDVVKRTVHPVRAPPALEGATETVGWLTVLAAATVKADDVVGVGSELVDTDTWSVVEAGPFVMASKVTARVSPAATDPVRRIGVPDDPNWQNEPPKKLHWATVRPVVVSSTVYPEKLEAVGNGNWMVTEAPSAGDSAPVLDVLKETV